MDKKQTFWGAAGFVVLYFVAVFIAEFIGFIDPICWMLAPAVGALFAAFPYRWLALRWKRFGLGTLLAVVFGGVMAVLGEFDLLQLIICIGCGLLSDVLRLGVKRDYVAYPLLALGNIASIIYMWLRKEWYLQGAAREVGQSYADAMAPLQNTLWFIIALVAIILLAECGLWMAKRWIK